MITTYGAIALAGYEDSLFTTLGLQHAVALLITSPSDDTLQAARVPHQQTVALRFGNPIVDDWEGRVNAWSLGQWPDRLRLGRLRQRGRRHGYPERDRHAEVHPFGGRDRRHDHHPALIAGSLHEADGIEANVASGYHAIEFLLWGQDLNGTGPGAGTRPFTDFATGDACTGGTCDCRAAYLQAATDLIVADLTEMVGNWAEDGAGRTAITADPQAGLLAMLTGMGSLCYGELAGERIKLGLMLNDPKEERDCFSDNTHSSQYFDGVGIQNVYLASYARVDGSVVEGPSLSDLLFAADPAVDTQLKGELDASVAAPAAIKAAAEGGMAYDQMPAVGDAQGETLIMGVVTALVTQTASIDRAVTVTDGQGAIWSATDDRLIPLATDKTQWDNQLVALS